MKRSKFDEVAGNEAPGKVFDRYGFSETEWAALTPDQRATHYNRQNVCEHPYVYSGPDNEDIRSSHSFDPYAHTAHMIPHIVGGPCDCQTCDRKFGIPRDQEKRYVNPELVKEKLRAIGEL